MTAPSITSITFDKTAYNQGDTITCTVKYADSNTHGVVNGLGVITAVGSLDSVVSFVSGTTYTIPIVASKIGDFVLLHATALGGATPSSVTGGGCTWKKIGTSLTGTVNSGHVASVFLGTITAAGTANATITTTGTATALGAVAQEFHSSTGQLLLQAQASLDVTGTNTAPSLTPSSANQLYSVYALCSAAETTGQTAGYTYNFDSFGNVYAFNPSCSQTAQTPQFGNANAQFGIAILISAPNSAGTFTAVGGIVQSQTSSISINPQAVGDIIVMHLESEGSAPPLSITGGNCNWQQVGMNFNSAVNPGVNEAVFVGTATATGAATATITYNGTPASVNNRGQEFYSSTGQYTFISQAPLDSSGTNTMPTLTPTAPGQLYAVSVLDTATFTAGATPGYVYETDVNGNGFIYNPSCTSDPQAPTIGDSTAVFGLAILLSAGQAVNNPTPTPTPVVSPLIASIATHSGVDPFGNPFPQGIQAEQGVLNGPSISVANTISMDSTGFNVYNGAPVPANLQMSITPTTGITTKTPVIFNQSGGTPAANANAGATAFSGHGDLQIVDGLDLSAYATERRSLATGTDQTVSSTTFATFLSSAVKAGASAREYRIKGEIFCAPNQSAGKIALQWIGPGATIGHINFTYKSPSQINCSGALGNGVSSAGFISMTMVAGNEQDITVDGVIQVPAGVSGTFALQGAEGTSGDSFIVRQFSYIDVMPV